MGPGDLERLLSGVPVAQHPDLLVAPVMGADNGVLRLSDELAIVQSVDFFPPMLADSRAFGRIAAANALSDIYCAGALPRTALSLLALPRDSDFDAVREVLLGAQEKLDEAGVLSLGGHTIIDKEVKFGLAVTGVVHPDRLLRHNTPQIGDVLLLSKPLGSGVLVTAFGKGLAADGDLALGVEVMSALNRSAAEPLFDCGAHCATDITGFGLLGHARDMLSLGHCGIELDFAALPLYPTLQPGALLDWILAGAICGGTARNIEYMEGKADYGLHRDDQAAKVLLNDSQTSGGLLVALPPERSAEYCEGVQAAGGAAPVAIGRVVEEHPGIVKVV
ncbi:selenide, water dikinase SelD [bacterium]|nr:selenide, water dikinase SelD [bacterium]